MNSIKFPQMFKNTSTTAVVEGKEASDQDIKLLMASENGEFIGDPGFGVSIRKYFYEQNGYVLKDLIIDEIFSKIKIFAPQLNVTRKDIKITQKKDKFIATITGINKVDFTPDMLELVIFDEEER